MNVKIDYQPNSISGPSYTYQVNYQPNNQSKTEPSLLRTRQTGKAFGSVKITGGNQDRQVNISGSPSELRMLAADLCKLAAWLDQ